MLTHPVWKKNNCTPLHSLVIKFCFPTACPADTACMNSNPYRRRSSSYTQSTQSHPSVLASHRHMSSWGRSYEDNCEFHSLPASSNNSKVTDQFRCLSLDQHRGSVQLPLFHSNSAPAMSELQRRRRLSLGAPARSESWQGERYGGWLALF